MSNTKEQSKAAQSAAAAADETSREGNVETTRKANGMVIRNYLADESVAGE